MQEIEIIEKEQTEETVEHPRVITEYITIKDGIITGNYITDGKLPEGAIAVKDFAGVVGDKMEYYKNGWTRKTDVELVKEGIEPMKAGYKWNSDQTGFVEMSQAEKIQAGLEELPQGKKIEGGQLVSMTDEEKLADGQLSQEEYNNIQRQKIMKELDGIDRKTIRPLRAILSGLGTEEDKAMLADLERQAQIKRVELEKLMQRQNEE